jgi:hypothetical protein
MENLHLKDLLCWIPRGRVVTIVGRLVIFINNLRVGLLQFFGTHTGYQ